MNDGEREKETVECGQTHIRMTDILMFAMNHIPEGVFLIREDGRFLLVNDTAYRILGYTQAELLGMGVPDIDPNFSYDSWSDYWHERTTKQPHKFFETLHRTKDGSLIPVEIHSYHFDYNDQVYSLALVFDITARKREEEKLREREEAYRSLSENLPISLLRYDRDCRRTYVNLATQKSLGETMSSLIGKTPVEFKPQSAEARAYQDKIRKVMETGQPDESEYTSVIPNPGRQGNKILYLRIVPEYNSRGEIVGALSIAQDITDLKDAVRQLRTLAENHPDSIVRYDTDGHILYVNPVIVREYDVPAEHFIGKTHLDSDLAAINLELPHLHAAILRTAKEGVPNVMETSLFTRAGERYFEIRFIPEKDDAGIIMSVLSIGRDITERKRAEDALRESRRQLLEAQRLAHIGIWEIDLTTHRIIWSEEMFRIFERDSKSFIPTYKNFIDSIHPEDHQLLFIAHRQAVKGHQKVSKFTYRLLFTDRRIKYVHEERDIFYSPEGKPLRVFGFSQDITEIQEIEEEKKKLAFQLTQSQKLEYVGRLAGGVAHDFNNMLNVIIGNAELAMSRMSPSDPFYKFFNDILNAGVRSADLTRQLLAFARKQTISPRVLDLNDTIESMLKILRRLIGENIKLVWIPGEKLWPVKMDPSQIDQLLANLALNARDAIDQTGQIVIETANQVCDEACCSAHPECISGKYVLLMVSDDGCGMDQETLTHIFEPFFTTKKEGQGTGLGLATVYGIVNQNGGFIYAYSEAGRGTTFKIYLPYNGEARREATVCPIRRMEGGTETVLIVDDEPGLLEVSRNMLATLGYQTLTAGGASEALQLVEGYNGTIDLLITDIVMPVMSGKDLSEKLMAVKPGMKRLYMSGYTADVIARQGILEEGVQFISKPFFLNDLAAKVREVLKS